MEILLDSSVQDWGPLSHRHVLLQSMVSAVSGKMLNPMSDPESVALTPWVTPQIVRVRKSTASGSAMAKSDSGQKSETEPHSRWLETGPTGVELRLAAPRALAESRALHRLFDRSRPGPEEPGPEPVGSLFGNSGTTRPK